MFNGIIYNQGKILNIKKNPKYVTGSSVIEVFSKVKLKKKILESQFVAMAFVLL